MEISSADGAVGLEDFVVVREGDLGLVAGLLVVLPGILTVALLTSHPLVLLLHLLGVGLACAWNMRRICLAYNT